MSQATIGRLERGGLRLKDDQIYILARALGRSPGDILIDRPDDSILVCGRLNSDAVIEDMAGDPLHLCCPRDLHVAEPAAVQIAGDWLPCAADGWFVVYDRAGTEKGVPTDVFGRTCIVQLADGRMMLRQVRRGYTWGRYNLFSVTTAGDVVEDVDLEWAAPIKMLMAPDTVEPR